MNKDKYLDDMIQKFTETLLTTIQSSVKAQLDSRFSEFGDSQSMTAPYACTVAKHAVDHAMSDLIERSKR